MASPGQILRARAAGVRRRLAEEAGFGLLEVLVSALIVLLVSMGVFAAFDASGRTADANKSKSIASSLAQSDQERMRSLAVTSLSSLDSTQTIPVDGENYTVRSQASYVSGPDDATNCTSTTDAAPRYLKMTSTVSWPDRRGIDPVVIDSLRTITNGSISGLGTLAISVVDRAGAGVSGVGFTITGAATRTGTTNSAGCLTFGYIPAGNYTISGSKTGFVDSNNPTASTISDTATVAADGVATESYQYDQAGGVTANYVTNTYGSTTATTASSSTGFTLSNSSLGALPTKTFSHASATTSSTGLVNFPFTSQYEAWAGTCADNEPPASQPSTFVSVGKGTTTAVSVRQPRLRFNVNRRTSTASSTTNYANVPSGTATVKVKPTSGTCTQTVTATFISNTGSTSSSGATGSFYSTYEASLPFGTNYTVCAAYSSGTIKGGNAQSGVPNQVYTGSTYGTTLTIPYSTTAYTGC